ncbi:MAG TPA: hypothetical protein PLG56_06695, partial [Lacunisphaera sp.]|nr:hypothetical protein [Lacunisphaera sp.]
NTPAASTTAHEAAHLEKLRSQLTTDIEAMQQQEASLKEYEQRLRLLMQHAQQPPPHHAPRGNQTYLATGPDSQQALDAEWDKYNRAHALLEAARRGLTDDRLAFKEREDRLAQREQQVGQREAWVKAREQEIAAAQAAKAVTPDSNPSFVTKLLRPRKPKPAA